MPAEGGAAEIAPAPADLGGLADGGYNLGMLNARAVNIALRTAHIAAMGVLLGGHAFDVPAQRLVASLWWTIATGAALAVVEAGPRLLWFHQLRGVMTLAKLVLVALVPWFWQQRLAILLAVVVIASVGSHMPARFRYYSIVYRRVLQCGPGPGTSQLEEELEDEESQYGNRPIARSQS